MAPKNHLKGPMQHLNNNVILRGISFWQMFPSWCLFTEMKLAYVKFIRFWAFQNPAVPKSRVLRKQRNKSGRFDCWTHLHSLIVENVQYNTCYRLRLSFCMFRSILYSCLNDDCLCLKSNLSKLPTPVRLKKQYVS